VLVKSSFDGRRDSVLQTTAGEESIHSPAICESHLKKGWVMEKQYYSFIVKIHDGRESLRGYIERVSNRQRAYFTDLSEMNKFISDQLAAPQETQAQRITKVE
jgi:hypothetical protein